MLSCLLPVVPTHDAAGQDSEQASDDCSTASCNVIVRYAESIGDGLVSDPRSIFIVAPVREPLCALTALGSWCAILGYQRLKMRHLGHRCSVHPIAHEYCCDVAELVHPNARME